MINGVTKKCDTTMQENERELILCVCVIIKQKKKSRNSRNYLLFRNIEVNVLGKSTRIKSGWLGEIRIRQNEARKCNF